ncbi:MAG: lamin tail domain-containing protein [Bacteroidia bacterium]|nr:lamin tail domain-containing protein [Bacteroidia bacterium]
MRCLFCLSLLWSQAPEILRFIPGRYRENPHHRIDLYNPYSYPLSIGGWLLVTREYSVRLPAALTLAPGQQYRLAKRGGNLTLDGYPDFLIRIPDRSQPGEYVALIDKEGKLRKGLYLAPLAQVLFLPDSGINITRDGKRIAFYLPSETAPSWEYVPWEPDPITGVVRIGNTWRYTVSDTEREAHLYAPIRFSTLVAAYEGGAVHLTWEVEGRERCQGYFLEKWEAPRGWKKLRSFPCPSAIPTRQKAEYYDLSVKAYTTYHYRLVYEGGPSLRLESAPTTLTCYPQQTRFRLEAQAGLVRLWLAQSQPIKVRLLDEYFIEQLRIYDGWVNGGVENIFVWDTSQVRKGSWVVVWTPQRRYWERLCTR